MPRITEAMSSAEFDPAIHNPMLPLLATPKVDGIRFYIRQGHVYSRSNIWIANKYIQLYLPSFLPEGADGELLVGDVAAPDHFQRTQSVCMSADASLVDLQIFVFDYVPSQLVLIPDYIKRLELLRDWWAKHTTLFLSIEPVIVDRLTWRQSLGRAYPGCGSDSTLPDSCSPIALSYALRGRVTILYPVVIRKPEQVEVYLKQCLSKGFEGIMLRTPYGGYKFGRSTQKEGLLIKYKPFADSEATILSCVELEHNENEATISETGKTKRSSSAEGKRPGGTLGSFWVKDFYTGVEFSVGGGKGLTQQLRQEIWDNQPEYIGKLIKYSYLATGTKADGKPRMPKFLGFRDKSDLPS